MFTQVKIRKISEEVFRQIKDAIVKGDLKPGERLPTERQMMVQMGVSRVPIREALKLLENMGFITTVQGGGSYVRSLVTDRVRDPLNRIMKENVEKVFDLMEVRKHIESWSAYHAAERATDKDVAALEEIVKEMKRSLESGKTPPNRLDVDFHLTVSRCCHNIIQAHLMFTIHDVFSEYFNFLIEKICFNMKYQEAIYQQHQDIYKAIKNRSSEDARDKILQHLNFVDTQLRQILKGEPLEG
jgi:GntR family transcriptional regulator, transcriptional repressor for pyruvate dehydrogenase complex